MTDNSTSPKAIETDAGTDAGTDERSLLRLITCGSVDDGKSTLMGRILVDANLVPDDQLASLKAESAHSGNVDSEGIDVSLLLDGLEAERAQGITIDVAYRYWSTKRRAFIVADSPGHEQYTRNMATAASTCEAAIILVDARKGIIQQTRRHSIILSLLGVRHVVLAINKLDLVDFDEARYEEIVEEYQSFLSEAADGGNALEFETLQPIPLSGLNGDNVVKPSQRLGWYEGPTLLEYLEELSPKAAEDEGPLRFIVQWINRPNPDFRGYSGSVASGTARVGDEIVVAVSGRTSRIERIVLGEEELQEAPKGGAATLTLNSQVDISRGDVIADAAHRPEVSDQFSANIVWTGDDPLQPGRRYFLKMAGRTVRAQVMAIKHAFDINSYAHLAAAQLKLNDVGQVNIATNAPLAFAPYAESRDLGGFVLIDPYSNQTLAAGMILHSLRRADNISTQHLELNKERRAALNGHKPGVIWFTGLSGSGKSTIANAVETRLYKLGHHSYLLDGDNIRIGLNKDLGFREEDRVENIRRVSEVARLMVDAGLLVLVSFISPYRAEREFARSLFEDGEFLEVFVDTPLEECARRDVKGLYAKAFAGDLPNFTGVSAPYEAPESPDLHLDTMGSTSEDLADSVVTLLRDQGRFD